MYVINQINTQFSKDTANWNPFVFAYNKQNSFEWGAYCDKATLPVANFPIRQIGEGYPNVGYLMIATERGQYQIYWNGGTDGNKVAVTMQNLTKDGPPISNQLVLWQGNPIEGQSFTLTINQKATTEQNHITIAPN